MRVVGNIICEKTEKKKENKTYRWKSETDIRHKSRDIKLYFFFLRIRFNIVKKKKNYNRMTNSEISIHSNNARVFGNLKYTITGHCSNNRGNLSEFVIFTGNFFFFYSLFVACDTKHSHTKNNVFNMIVNCIHTHISAC